MAIVAIAFLTSAATGIAVELVRWIRRPVALPRRVP